MKYVVARLNAKVIIVLVYWKPYISFTLKKCIRELKINPVNEFNADNIYEMPKGLVDFVLLTAISIPITTPAIAEPYLMISYTQLNSADNMSTPILIYPPNYFLFPERIISYALHLDAAEPYAFNDVLGQE